MGVIIYRTKEDILPYSNKCNSRYEFQVKYGSAYSAARRLGVIDEVCKHMITKSYSTPQLILKKITETILKSGSDYNCRKVIKPYEIDVYFDEFKIGFEYDGERWHRGDEINKTILCKNKKVLLVTIKENNRKYELDVKKQVIENLIIINSWCNLDITEDDVNNIEININELLPNLNNIKNICSNYTDINTFIKKEKKVYSFLHRNGLIDEYTSHMYKRRLNYEKINIVEDINKYNNIGDLIKFDNQFFQYIAKHKLRYLLKNLKRKGTLWTKVAILKEINKYETLVEFKKNAGLGCFNAAIRLNMNKELNKLKKKRGDFCEKNLIETISKYNNLIDLIKNDSNTYEYCRRNNLKCLYSHLKKRRNWKYDDLVNVVKKYKTLKELDKNDSCAYSIIRKRYKFLLEGLKKYSN